MPSLSKCSSLVYRSGQIYFDERLAPYHIGCGQQFFLLHIARMPGINQYELADKDHYDKGTTARAVKKLEEQGYILRKSDASDKRITKLYVTKKGEALVSVIQQIIQEWHEILSKGLTQKERIAAEELMELIAENAAAYVKNR